MTATETISLVRMMLDDSRDWYFPDIVQAINDAQIRAVKKYYAIQDERFLRPLYAKDHDIDYDGVITIGDGITPADVMFPRAVRLYNAQTVNMMASISATYIDYYHFINNQFPSYDAAGVLGVPDFPKTAYYTIRKEPNAQYRQAHILFNSTPLFGKATVWYIREPSKFRYVYNDITEQYGLEVPSEYHPEIAMQAAEALNDIDVAEQERGEVAFQNQKLTLTNPSGN